MSNYQKEFPNFDPATLPKIPVGFEDTSWHNDACPQFQSRVLNLAIFVDYADPALREFPEASRFVVCEIDSEGAIGALYECESGGLATDDWSEVEAFVTKCALALV